MWRSRSVAAMLAALAASHAHAQSGALPPPDTLLRSSVDEIEEPPLRDRRRPQGQSGGDRTSQSDRSPLTRGYPAAFGAGTTGFDSTNRSRRRPSGGRTRPGAAGATLPAPLSLSPQQSTATPNLSGATSSSAASPATRPAATTSAATATSASAANAPATTGSVALLRGTTARPSQLVRVPTGSGADGEAAMVNTASLSPSAATILRRRTSPEEDAFAAIGMRFGAFTVLPAVEIAGGYDSNPARVPGGRASTFVVVTPELLARSDWERHEFTATLRGSYTTYQQTPELDRPTFDGKLAGRIDVTRNTHLNLEAIAIIGTDNPGSPNVQAGLSRFPIYTTLGGTFGITQRFNRLEVTAKGLYDRTEYQDSHFTDGTTASNADRNFNRYGGSGRVAYELTPGLKPFVEGGADTRVHDLAVDSFGLQRDSNGWYVKGGTTFEFSRKLTGEIALGWLNRSYKDPSLQELAGFTVDGSLIYAMSGLTNVKFNASTTAGETTVPGTAGVFSRNAGVEVEHAFRRWLIGSLKFTYGFDDYVGSPRKDDRYAVSGSVIYKLNRMVQAKAEVRQEWLRSSTPGVNYDATVYLLGVRLQR